MGLIQAWTQTHFGANTLSLPTTATMGEMATITAAAVEMGLTEDL